MCFEIEKIIKIKKWNLYSLFLLFIPFATAIFLMFIMTDQVSFKNLIPVWNDEVGWWSYVRNMVKNINWPGHAGYNGEYAKIGNYGPWGVSPLLPYAFVGKIFGWKLYSMSMANMLFLGFGLFAFAVLVQADNRMIVKIAIVYLCTYISVGYTMTSMTESLRYSLTIILCGMCIHLSRRGLESKDGEAGFSRRDIVLFIISGIILLYAVNVWLILALFIPLFLWQVLRRQPVITKLIVIPVSTIVISAIEMYSVGLVSYSYAESVMNQIMAELKMGGVLAGLRFAVSNTFANLETVNLPNILKNENDALVMYFLLYLLLTVIVTVKVFRERSYQNFLTWYLLTGFLVGYCVLYTGSDSTLCRGTNAGLFAAVLCSCVFNSSEEAKAVDLYKVVYVAGIISMVASYDYFSWLITERVSTAQNRDVIIEEQQKLSDVMALASDNDAWDNTVAEYGTVDYWYLSMPEGAYGNYMLNGEANTKARYVVVRTSDGEAADIINTHRNNGHTVIFEDEIFTVLMRD